MTQKEILKIIELKKPKFDRKKATKWLKSHPIFVQELDAEIVANQYLNESKEKERIDKLDTKKGILLGTIDFKWKDGRIKRVFADILTDEGTIERLQWWGSVPKENKQMQSLPILQMCEFKGSINEWTSERGDLYTNFDVEAIIPSTESFSPDALKFDEFSMINLDTEVEEIPEGQNMAVIFGKITSTRPFQEKTWIQEEDKFEFSSDHPYLLSDTLVFTMGVRANEDIYIQAYFAEQKLGFPTWFINDDKTKVESIKQVLAKMPVNSKDDREAVNQLQRQGITVDSIFRGFLVMIIGEIRVKRVESADEVRTFIHMTPTFISVKSSPAEEDEVPIQATLEVEDPEELADAEEIEQFVSPPPTPKITEEVPTGLTEAKLIYEAINQFGTQGESMAKSKVKELKAQYERFNIPIDIANLIKTAAKELGVDITGYEKQHAKEVEEKLKVQQAESSKEKMEILHKKVVEKEKQQEKPLLFDAGKVIKLIQEQSEIKDYDTISNLIKAKREELGFFVNDTAAAHIVAKDLNVDTKALQITGSPIRGTGEDTFDIPLIESKKTTPAPTKKKPTKRKRKESPWINHFKYINGILASIQEVDNPVDLSVLPMPIWDILLGAGYTFEPQSGVIKFTADNLQLDTKIKKTLSQFFKKNPDIQLHPPAIEDVEKAIREKLTELKEVVPSASPEHLKPMLASFNLDAPVELITKIWETL